MVSCDEGLFRSVLCRPGSDLLFRVLRRSTIGAGAIYGRVRDGIGYGRPARATRPAKNRGMSTFCLARMVQGPSALFCWREWGKCPDRAVAFREWGMCPKRCKSFSIYQVSGWTMIMRAIKPIERLVPVSYAHCCVSTPGLSTWSSSTVLKGELVLRWVSRLDAFSGYPVHT